jgi:hypothetical protein
VVEGRSDKGKNATNIGLFFGVYSPSDRLRAEESICHCSHSVQTYCRRIPILWEDFSDHIWLWICVPRWIAQSCFFITWWYDLAFRNRLSGSASCIQWDARSHLVFSKSVTRNRRWPSDSSLHVELGVWMYTVEVLRKSFSFLVHETRSWPCC